MEKTMMTKTSGKNYKDRLKTVYSEAGILIVLFLMVILLAVSNPMFLKINNLTNIVRQITFIALIGLGVMPIIVSGGIDLSSGSVMAIVSIMAGKLAQVEGAAMPLAVVLLAGITIGAFCGGINGFLVSYTKIPPFIATLGMMTILRGSALIVSDGRPVNKLSDSFKFIGGGDIFGIPFPIVILIIMSAFTWYIMTQTRHGRHIYAIGGNEDAAKMSGINIKKVIILVYAYAGLCASLSGMVLTARIQSGQPSLGEGFELDAIAAVVIGGTSLSGGVGTVFGVISGALVIGVLNNGMDLLQVSAYWQQIAQGLIIIVAVVLDVARRGKKD